MAFRFIHTGDLHFGSPFKGLAKVSERVAEQLRSATIRTFDAIVDLSIAEKVDALLIAGDVYDSADRSLKAQLAFQRALARLDASGIRTFICHGNHDPLDGWEAKLKFSPLCHQFGADVEAIPLFPERPEDVVIMGVSYATRHVRENLSLRFLRPSGVRFVVGLLHANVSDMPGHENYAPCTVGDLAASGVDYWALGHIHNRSILSDCGPSVAYPGTPQGRSPKETGPRGVNLVSVDDDGRVDIAFHVTDVVRWATIDVAVEQHSNEQELLDDLSTSVERLLHEAGGRSVVYDLTLTGTSGLHVALTSRRGLADIVEHLNSAFGGNQTFAWCGRAKADTQMPFDRIGRANGEDFVGVLLRQVDECKMNQLARSRVSVALDVLLSDDRVAGHLGSADGVLENVSELLDAAEQICLEELGEVKPE